MNEIEEKKQIISRLDRSFQHYEDLLKNEEDDYHKFIDKEIKKYTKKEKKDFKKINFLNIL